MHSPWFNTQSGEPTKEAGLRVIGNLTRPDGVLAPKSEAEQVGRRPIDRLLGAEKPLVLNTHQLSLELCVA
jgi:hypothetical protein